MGRGFSTFCLAIGVFISFAFSSVRSAELKSWDRRSVRDIVLPSGSSIPGKKLFFVTHASRCWRNIDYISNATNERVRQATAADIPVLYLIHDFTGAVLDSYFLEHSPTFVYQSYGGECNLKVDADEVFFAGGCFDLCLAETIRDVILGRKNSATTLRITYLADAVYNFVSVEREQSGFSDYKFFSYVRKGTFKGNLFGKQNHLASKVVRTEDYLFKIFRNGEFVDQHGSGSQIVELNFVMSDWNRSSRVFEGTRDCARAVERLPRKSE